MGLLGPNGAGKTTAVRVVATLLAPDAGAVRVAAADERLTDLERTSSWWAPVRDEARAPPTTGELPTRSHPVAAPPAGTKILSTLDDGGGSFPGSGDRDLLIEVAPADSAILRTHR